MSTRQYTQQLHRLPLPRRAHVRVDLRGGQRLVAEQLLDHAQVRPAVQQLGGEGVAEEMRVEPAPTRRLTRLQSSTTTCFVMRPR